ncbi:DEAD/DEAH box helicase [Azoarcus sp. L1K30]|uniref:DEAD/DEAH box helicase n=1 Tax=Azoarcus sp. L1K30 TaxID=2820277 RepID=UPI001B82FFF1|nr:DEAD/DEAH box helicase [Azoarcus sp. L1K30]MBR0566624.1 DEAD/DEAH box helicase [Azoarcus sp. L1K30]
MTVFDTYSEADIATWLGQRELEKGRAYVRATSDLQLEGELLTAQVQGTVRLPYRVAIRINPHPLAGRTLLSSCSCPVGGSCKHVAATLIAWLNRRRDPNRPREQVLAWVDAFRAASGQSAAVAARNTSTTHGLRYLIRLQPETRRYVVSCFKVRLDRQGQIRSAESWSNFERALDAPPSFIDDTDLDILRLLWAHRPRGMHDDTALPLAGRNEQALLEALLDSGRVHFDDLMSPVLTAAAERPGQLEWITTSDGRRAPALRVEPPAELVMPLVPPWYVERKSNQAGPITLQAPPEQVVRLLALPPLTPAESELVAETLRELAPALPGPASSDAPTVRIGGPAIAVLRIGSADVFGVSFRNYPRYGVDIFDYATLAFRYGALTIDAHDTALFHALPDGRTARLERDAEFEAAAARRLTRCGLNTVPPGKVQTGYDLLPPNMLGLSEEEDWAHFTARELPLLRAEGWEVDMPADFRHHATDIDDIVLDVDEDENGWLDISPGIEVDGRPVALAPLLSTLFAQDGRWLSGGLEQIGDDESIFLHHEELGRLRIPARRLKPLVRALVDLFDSPGDPMRLPAFDAARLADLELPGRGAETLAALAARIRNAEGIKSVRTPRGFKAELRPYQLEGLAWLQHLVRHNLAGILADDMGLGKTAQALAHLLTEKQAGRLDQPALVILPTSLVFNWQAEAKRFAPRLKVLNLHGADRHARFDELDGVDVALTTYPLLWRDAEALQAREWSLLILDEAQTVKNAASKGAQVIRQIRARHRLGLTGTPLENHLGELWAQFDFLLPGFLGDLKQFTRVWRTPIEKHGDTVRRDLLAARLKPFILRRRKEDVATELPPKTIIVRSVALEGGQRDLYETVRAAMNEKIRGEIASRGFARSQIVILDALLKLRQVCCDPRLLKSPAAARVAERAKLDMLMDMLPELIDEGRRILVFSQFTQMLSLIAAELDAAQIGWVSLTGDTRDRRIPVEDFQKGRAPVFLISLKAGGVGLNLTAADTVIHYDPWWNPAAENQATDRAHRIGQDKPVFVFKLICAGSIEERILNLQDKKAALAAGVLSEDGNALAKFGEADIAALLAPLPAVRK